MFSFLLRRRVSPPRPRTKAEKRLGTEDYSLKGKAKAFFKLNQWISRIRHYFYSVNFIYASKKVLVCLMRDLQNQYHQMYNICWTVFCISIADTPNSTASWETFGQSVRSREKEWRKFSKLSSRLSSRPDWLPMGSEDHSRDDTLYSCQHTSMHYFVVLMSQDFCTVVQWRQQIAALSVTPRK